MTKPQLLCVVSGLGVASYDPLILPNPPLFFFSGEEMGTKSHKVCEIMKGVNVCMYIETSYLMKEIPHICTFVQFWVIYNFKLFTNNM